NSRARTVALSPSTIVVKLLTETLSVGSGTPFGFQLVASNQLLEVPPTQTLSAGKTDGAPETKNINTQRDNLLICPDHSSHITLGISNRIAMSLTIIYTL